MCLGPEAALEADLTWRDLEIRPGHPIQGHNGYGIVLRSSPTQRKVMFNFFKLCSSHTWGETAPNTWDGGSHPWAA